MDRIGCNILYYFIEWPENRMDESGPKYLNVSRRRTRRLTRTVTAEQILLLCRLTTAVLIPNALTICFLYMVAYSYFHLDTTYRL